MKRVDDKSFYHTQIYLQALTFVMTVRMAVRSSLDGSFSYFWSIASFIPLFLTFHAISKYKKAKAQSER